MNANYHDNSFPANRLQFPEKLNVVPPIMRCRSKYRTAQLALDMQIMSSATLACRNRMVQIGPAIETACITQSTP
jgi:hypothetical protein